MSNVEPEVKADFHVKLQSDQTPPTGDPGRSLSAEIRLLNERFGELCTAIRGLVQLVSVLDRSVKALHDGKPDFTVMR